MNATSYHEIRTALLTDPAYLVDLEKKYTEFLEAVLSNAIQNIVTDFDKAGTLLPFWLNYRPLQRGRQPRGTSIPWSEVGETSIGANVLRGIIEQDSDVSFPGLPSGADIRFETKDALIHFDIKLTGPNDRADEIVASPNQISGDGSQWNDFGVVNSSALVQGKQRTMPFQPELPPFYVTENGEFLICLTYFLKGVYSVKELGIQPLKHLDLVCVPNGLLTFDSSMYINYPGLFIPGKDDQKAKKKRTRVRLAPLKEIADWRWKQIWER